MHKQLLNKIKFTSKNVYGNYTTIPILNNKRLPYINTGAFKEVYFLSKRTVLKICKDVDSFDLEIKKYKQIIQINKNIAAEILAYDRSKRAIIQERVSTDLNYIKRTIKRIDKRRSQSMRKICARLDLYDVGVDCNYNNIGVKKGKLVIYDFGV